MKIQLIIFLILTCGFCFGQNKPFSITFMTDCDSIYKDKGYRIIQHHFLDGIDTEGEYNTVFRFLRVTDSDQNVIYQDTIYSRTSKMEFRDFNNDGVKDILIQNISDARSNWTYYLYLVDTVGGKIKKIKGFEEIKNPNYLPQYDLICNYVVSGKDWTSFYKIKGDSIKDYEIVIYDDHTENGTYESDYKKAIQTILKNEKTCR